MKHYWDPELKDVLSEIETVQRQVEDLKPRLVTAEHIAQLLGWATLKQDVEDIKQQLVSLSNRLSRAGL